LDRRHLVGRSRRTARIWRARIIAAKQQGRLLPINNAERQAREAIWNALKIMRSLNFESPFTVFLSLIDMKNTHYSPTVAGQDDAEVVGFDRDMVLASEIVINEMPTDIVLLNLLRFPLFDEIANSAGWTQSPH
jgi:hypothetical protein